MQVQDAVARVFTGAEQGAFASIVASAVQVAIYKRSCIGSASCRSKLHAVVTLKSCNYCELQLYVSSVAAGAVKAKLSTVPS